MNGMPIERQARLMGWVTLLGGALIVLYWVVFFTDAGMIGHDGLTTVYESAFPIADALLAALLFLASRALVSGHRTGPFLLVTAAAMTLNLGVLDLTFYARIGWYWPLTGAGLIELAANACCIAGGALGLRTGWKLWSVA